MHHSLKTVSCSFSCAQFFIFNVRFHSFLSLEMNSNFTFLPVQTSFWTNQHSAWTYRGHILLLLLHLCSLCFGSHDPSVCRGNKLHKQRSALDHKSRIYLIYLCSGHAHVVRTLNMEWCHSLVLFLLLLCWNFETGCWKEALTKKPWKCSTGAVTQEAFPKGYGALLLMGIITLKINIMLSSVTLQNRDQDHIQISRPLLAKGNNADTSAFASYFSRGCCVHSDIPLILT